ncbi:hypothetical protein [Alteromonas sp. ASW11-130]|uniref:hypothetical protein n=1 Tax=Alteromonas sp. ASW11-130 TaxID=3015775 RepID=UPI002242A9D5|nr:hypothetical protein [Alteromonas sp. ASW11-130]MCW8090386.1 hypothetical protein [Alteromonas sp. ASW11-130]
MRPPAMYSQAYLLNVVGVATLILMATFAVILWQYQLRSHDVKPEPASPLVVNNNDNDMQLADLFLKADFKMGDVANKLKVSKYKTSRASRHAIEATSLESGFALIAPLKHWKDVRQASIGKVR